MQANIVSIINLFDVNRSHFIQDAYAVILGREPDSSGIATYENKLRNGAGRLRRKIILALAKSPEARARSVFLPMIAREAVRMQRWRFLPWNRSAIALAATQVESQSSIEALTKSLESKLSSIEDRLPLVELDTERKLNSIEHRIESMANSVDSKLNSIQEKIPPIEHRMESLTKSVEWKLGKIEEKLPLIEHTTRSLKGISFALHRLESAHRLENELHQNGVTEMKRTAA